MRFSLIFLLLVLGQSEPLKPQSTDWVLLDSKSTIMNFLSWEAANANQLTNELAPIITVAVAIREESPKWYRNVESMKSNVVWASEHKLDAAGLSNQWYFSVQLISFNARLCRVLQSSHPIISIN